MIDSPSSQQGLPSSPTRGGGLLSRIAKIGASAQAAIPGLYAWATTVAPVAWSPAARSAAKVIAAIGVVALVTAPIFEILRPPRASPARFQVDARSRRREVRVHVSHTHTASHGSARSGPEHPASALVRVLGSTRTRRRTAPSEAAPQPPTKRSRQIESGLVRIWSIWGLVLSSAIVWVLVPSALSPVRFDSVRGVLGIVGWALFAFASAGPPLRADPNTRVHVASDGPLEPRSKLVRGDGVYVGVGAMIALCMQVVGWELMSPERAVLVRLVTLASAMAVVGAMTSLAVARHSMRVAQASRFHLRSALPWIATALFLASSGALLWLVQK